MLYYLQMHIQKDEIWMKLAWTLAMRCGRSLSLVCCGWSLSLACCGRSLSLVCCGRSLSVVTAQTLGLALRVLVFRRSVWRSERPVRWSPGRWRGHQGSGLLWGTLMTGGWNGVFLHWSFRSIFNGYVLLFSKICLLKTLKDCNQ